MPRKTRWPFVSVLLLLLTATWGFAQQETLQPAPAGTFSIVVIPDTQLYEAGDANAAPNGKTGVTNPVFDAITEWIAANIEEQRIVFVSHVGDVVDRNHPDHWPAARRYMDQLHGKVPYGISVGNHDMERDGDSSRFQRYFPQSRFQDFSWYGGSFESDGRDQSVSGNNANSFQLFSAEGMDFVFLHLECNAPDDVLDWANQVIETYPDRRVLVTAHMMLGPRDKPRTPQDFFDAPKGRMRWSKRHGRRGNSPEQMWEKCFRKHANLFMIFCGDQSKTQAMRQTSRGVHGNLIHEVLSDYVQAGLEGGLRLYRFIPQENLIQAYTYCPLQGKLCEGTEIVPDRSEHQFTIEYDMSRRNTARTGAPPQGSQVKSESSVSRAGR